MNITIKKPICEQCEAEGKGCSVTAGPCSQTLMGIMPDRWDADGTHHPAKDPNITTCTYYCSNGHQWAEKR